MRTFSDCTATRNVSSNKCAHESFVFACVPDQTGQGAPRARKSYLFPQTSVKKFVYIDLALLTGHIQPWETRRLPSRPLGKQLSMTTAAALHGVHEEQRGPLCYAQLSGKMCLPTNTQQHPEDSNLSQNFA